MPGKIKVKILAGRNLPVMDRSGDTTDAYVEIKFGNTTYKTDVCRKSLNPQWNSEWYKFEVEDAELQDEPLQIRLMDHDTYSANDAIGKVYVNLNPLLLPGVPPPVKNIWTLEASMNSSTGSQGGSVMTGWLPVYDTMHGIRGEVKIIVKVELFLDFNKFRQSSCGVTFFYSPIVPHGYHAQVIHGFVEELVVSDDPEYKWIDKIRTPRASNEARQTLFLKLSNEVQRKIGLKALDLGGNAVIGYLQNFDLEGESGIVARGIGTVVTLVKVHDFPPFLSENPATDEFTTQSLKPIKPLSDCSESEGGSPRLPSRHHYYHHHHQSSSTSNLNNLSPVSSPTLLSSKFPLYGENVPLQPVTPLKVVEYKNPLKRQSSIQSYTSLSSRRNPVMTNSNLSLADDIIDESSLRQMMALEDMRGEPQGNRFSRGLRNLRYLPQNVKRSLKSSVDEESDLESAYSSTWSVCGSDTTSLRSLSIVDLQQNIRRKKFTHRKTTGDGMAAMLIRSVHSGGLPLDIVKEDRETPTPSPVNFVDNDDDDDDQLEKRDSSSPSKSDKNTENQNLIEESENAEEESPEKTSNKILLVTYSKLKASPENDAIPMISSSETDTSSSEDDDDDDEDDDPSESSTNYNILDDTLSLLDPSSPEVENCPMFSDSQIKLYPTSTPSFTSQLASKEGDNEEKEALINEKDDNDEDKNTVTKEKDDEEERTFLINTKDQEDMENVLFDERDDDEKKKVFIDEKDYGEEKVALIDEKANNKELKVLINDKNKQDEVKTKTEEKIEFISKNNEDIPLMHSMLPPPAYDNKKRNILPVDELLSSEFSSDVDSDLPVSAIPNDYRSRRPTKKLSSPSRTPAKSEEEKSRKDKKRPEPLHLSIPSQSSLEYFEERETLLSPSKSITVKPHSTPERSPKNSNKVLRHRLHKQLSVVEDEDYLSESSEDEYYNKNHYRSALPVKMPEKRLLINLDDDHYQSSSTDQRGKSPRRIERTDTVIYKGPKERNLLDSTNNETPPHIPPPLSPVIVNPSSPLLARSPSADANHLQVPGVNLRDIVPKSPYPPDETKSVFNFTDEARVAEMLNRKYRQTCMQDLIRVIDSKMLTHHRSESTKRRKHLAITKSSNTPSPDAHRRVHRHSRSRSPDSISSHHHHHHHHHSPHHLSKHSRSHHNSCESISHYHHVMPGSNTEPVMRHVSEELEEAVEVEAVKQLAHTKIANNVETERLEMHALNPKTETIAVTTVPSIPTTSSTTLTTTTSTNVPETKTTNTANATDNLCVSQSPSTRRHQQNNHHQEAQQQPQQQQQQTLQQQQPQQQGTSISPAENRQQQQQQHQKLAHSPATRNPGIPLHRRSSDSDLSITPKDNKSFKKGRSFRLRSERSRYPSRSMLSDKSSRSHSGNSLTGSDRSMGGYLKPSSGIARTMNQEALEMLEYPFITMQQYPPGFVLHIGGFVSARSVKLLERITNLEEPEGRDSWWTEIRMEVRSHARALACNVVIGYKEETSICDDVCVLSGSGTAAVINLHSTGQDQDNVLITHVQGPMTTSMESDKANSITDKNPKNTPKDTIDTTLTNQQQINPPLTNSTELNSQTKRPVKQRHVSESNDHEQSYVFPSSGCSLCHLPYNKSSMNFQVSVSKCAVCRRAKVPDVLFTTVELPESIPMTGRGCFIQATVCKSKKDLRGELNAKEISDCLPFLEYELHSLLLNKLRVRGMNGVFGLKVQVSIGERFIIGMAVGTAVYLTALPPPSLPQIATGNSWTNEEQLAEIQKSLVETVKKNMEFYQLKPVPLQEAENGRSMSDTDESEDELPELDLGLGMKDVCVLEVDDVEDMDRINLLMDERPPNDFHVVNTETIPGLEDLEIVRNLQMFTQVSRAKIPPGQSASMPSKYFARLLQTVYFKLRRMVPCALCDLQFKIAMPEQDEIQLSVVGMALGLGEPTKFNKFRRRVLSHSMSKDQVKKTDDNDMIFSLDEDHAENLSTGDSTPNPPNTPNAPNTQSATLNTVPIQKPRPRSPLRIKHTTHRHKHVPLKERYGVDITPLSYLPGGKIDRYLGNLNFFFIRESNSIRENGGLSGFIHSFVTEVLAIVRAHVTALGGNAIVAFFMSQCVLLHSAHKNQGQCLINVGGDVVNVSYFGNDKQQQPMSASSGNC